MRTLKIIFFFLFLTPNQTEKDPAMQEKEGSNDQSSMVQINFANISETANFGKLNTGKRVQYSSNKKLLKYFGMDQALSTELTRVFLSGDAHPEYSQDMAFIPEELLKHCYRSKSKFLDKESASIA